MSRASATPTIITGACVALIAVGCANRPTETAGGPVAVASVSSPKPEPSPPSPAMTRQHYRDGLLTGLGRIHRAAALDAVQVPDAVFDLGRLRRRVGANYTIVFTRGLALHGDTHIELMVEVERYDPRLADVLSALASDLTARPESWKPYEAVALATPVHSRQYFDVRPGGSLKVDPVGRVILLKVLPIDKEDFDRASAQDRGSQWVGADAVDPDGARRARQRWSEWGR